jgi:transcriptional regulator with XRE-family HTH domain
MSRSQDFVRRFHQIFGNVSMAEIARRLRLPHATVRNYFSGRLPSPDVLIKIAETTGVSINWLLTGEGPVYLAEAKGLNIDTLLDIKIEEAINRKIAASKSRREAAPAVRNRSFDIKAALEKYRDPNRIMSEWFKFEGRKYPQDFGVVFFSGWESFSYDEKLDAIRDAKKVLDRNLLRGEA